jgi:hypothetical protein
MDTIANTQNGYVKPQIVNITAQSSYAMNSQKAKAIDGALLKVWNRKIIKSMTGTNPVQNSSYADKYASTLERLRRKIEERKEKK